MIEQSLSNTNKTCYSVQIVKICNLNKSWVWLLTDNLQETALLTRPMMAWNWNLSRGLQLQHKLGSFPLRLFLFDENSSFPFLIPACNKNKTMDEIRSNPLLLTNPSLLTAGSKPSHPGTRRPGPRPIRPSVHQDRALTASAVDKIPASNHFASKILLGHVV